jgi:Protein of unknown function (DUF2782)
MRMTRLCRLLAAAAAATIVVAGAALAAPSESPAPAESPAVVPLPPDLDDADLGPQVTITKNDRETVEEARVNGVLAWVKVTPRHGRPYYLIPTAGGNAYIRRDSLDTGLHVPMWVLFSW